MRCPSCGRQLTQTTAGGIQVDACSGGCGGLWFDAEELPKVEYADEAAGASLLDIPRDPSVVLDPAARRRCPKDPGITMMRHFESVDARLPSTNAGSAAASGSTPASWQRSGRSSTRTRNGARPPTATSQTSSMPSSSRCSTTTRLSRPRRTASPGISASSAPATTCPTDNPGARSDAVSGAIRGGHRSGVGRASRRSS